MAIYGLQLKIIGRQAKDTAGKAIPGQQVSMLAKAAYRSGDKLKDQARDQPFDYRSRTQEVVHSEILVPKDAPGWLAPAGEKHGGGQDWREARERLWNTIEQVEKRKDSQLARELVILLPKELDKNQQVEVIREFIGDEFTSKGFVADFSLHRSRGGNNPHAHVLITTRPVEGDGFGKKPSTEGKFNGRGVAGMGAKSDLEILRTGWEKKANAALERAGSDKRIDHRSLEAQGIDRVPENKIGPAATAMERRGKVAESEQTKRVKRVRFFNKLLPFRRDIERQGEVSQDFGKPKGAKGFYLRSLKKLGLDRSEDMPQIATTLADTKSDTGRDQFREVVAAYGRDIQTRGEVSESASGVPWWAMPVMAAGWAAKKTLDVGKKFAEAAVEVGRKAADVAAEAARKSHQRSVEARVERGLKQHQEPEIG